MTNDKGQMTEDLLFAFCETAFYNLDSPPTTMPESLLDSATVICTLCVVPMRNAYQEDRC